MPSSSSSDELPRFDLPGESAKTGRYDAADAALTAERPALRSGSRASRPAIRRATPVNPDATDEVSVDQILLETYVEPPAPAPRRAPPMPVFVPPPPAPAQLAEVDALLERSDSPAPVSYAPVALPIPQPQAPIYVQDATPSGASRVGAVFAMAAVFVLTAAASFTLLAKPETLGRIRDAMASRLSVPAAHAVAPPVHIALPPVPTVTAAPAPVPTLAVEALPKPVVESTATLVTLPAYAEGHRIYVDGVAVATTSNTMKTRCGRHAIKIGSTGKGRTLDMPCGGELILR